jgi:DNA-binding IclR family transcriptional regulator
MMSNNIQAVDRVLQMLAAFSSERRELSVTDFANLLGVHKSTASRLAATLLARGFVERMGPNKLFRLGPEVGRLGLLALGGRDLITLARDVMERLAAETGETVNLAVLDGEEVVNIAQADGPHLVGVGNWTGLRTPLHCTSNGKVLLAFSDQGLPRGPLKGFTRRTITDPKKLRAELERVRRTGWATNLGEIEEGLYAVAAPILDDAGRCRAAFSVAGPEYRLPPDRLPELARLCQQAAQEVSTRLAGIGEATRTGPDHFVENRS